MLREMSGEVRLVEGDVLDRDDAALAQLEDAIDQKKGIAMGQQPQYALELRDFGFVIVSHRQLLRASRRRLYFEIVDFFAACDPNSEGSDAPGCSLWTLAGLTPLPGPSPTVPIGTCIVL
jgi:hypothetical protein